MNLDCKKTFFLLIIMLTLAGTLAACGGGTEEKPLPASLEVVTASSKDKEAVVVADATVSNIVLPTATTESSVITPTAAPLQPTVTSLPSTAPATPTNLPPTATIAKPTVTAVPIAKSVVAVPAVKKGVLLEPMSWKAQTWNNCAPMSAVMSLSYYGVTLTEEQCAQALRPNSGDKHVTPEELVAFIQKQGFRTVKRENGTLEKLQALVSAGIPVITQQWLYDGDDIGHYRVLRGYDLDTNVLVFNDSMDRHPKTVVTNALQDKLWKGFDRRYFPVYTAKQEATVMAILGEDADKSANMSRALTAAQNYAQTKPADIDAWRNLGYLQYELGDCKSALTAWEGHIKGMLASSENGPYNRFLWYQLWPVECYNAVGNYQQVIKIAPNEIEHTKVFAEARFEYAKALIAVGRKDEGIAQLKKAILDDNNYTPAYNMLAKLGVN